jgi:ring-1,2-phenylacetyl-CoA epoxidase subunit PaaD
VVNAIADIHAVLAGVVDPEIPVLSIVDLGIVREVNTTADGMEVVVTPTYSGCPAMHAIEEAIRRALDVAGFANARVRTALHPAWTTDWITAAGREKLEKFGIAPPGPRSTQTVHVHRTVPAAVACPHCGAKDAERLAEFGSTACKALYRCRICREPFDYFKPI